MSTVSMQLNGKNSSAVSKGIDSCHSKEYTENISPYLPNTVEAGSESYGTGENTHAVMRLRGSKKFVGVASVSFRFVPQFTSTLSLCLLTLYRLSQVETTCEEEKGRQKRGMMEQLKEGEEKQK